MSLFRNNGTLHNYPVGEWQLYKCEKRKIDECILNEKRAVLNKVDKVDKPAADSVDYDYYNAGLLQNNYNYIPLQSEKQCSGKLYSSFVSDARPVNCIAYQLLPFLP